MVDLSATTDAITNNVNSLWLMVAAGVLALLFVGAALGLAAAFIAKRMGFL